MMNKTAPGSNIEKRLRTMRILWVAFLWNIGLFALFAYFLAPASGAESGTLGASEQFPPLLIIFFVLGVAAVGLSFVMKQQFMRKAVSEQRLEHVQTGVIVALVLCEVAALFGLLALFLSGNRNAYFLFVIGAVGQFLHYPRREHILAATYKDGAMGGMGAES